MNKWLKRTLNASIVTLVTAISFTSLAGGPDRTINDGVYSWDQSLRGEEAYGKNCAAGCHLSDMTGSERAPGLAGDSFMLRWNGQNLANLFLRIQQTMPQTAPHSLSDQTYIDIVAYILSANGLPSGDDELVADTGLLETIKFTYEQ